MRVCVGVWRLPGFCGGVVCAPSCALHYVIASVFAYDSIVVVHETVKFNFLW